MLKVPSRLRRVPPKAQDTPKQPFLTTGPTSQILSDTSSGAGRLGSVSWACSFSMVPASYIFILRTLWVRSRLNIKDYYLWVTRSSIQLQVRRRCFTSSNLVKILTVLVGSGFMEDIREQSDPGPFPKARVIKQSCHFPQFHKHSTLAVSAFPVTGSMHSLPRGDEWPEAGDGPQWQSWVLSSIPGDKWGKEAGVKFKVRKLEVSM